MTAFKRSSRGFTLIEVMVAMAVIALVMVSLFRMQSGTFSLAEANAQSNTARLLAAEKLAEILSQIDEWPEEDRGEFDEGFDAYMWTSTISEAEFTDKEIMPDNDAGGLKRIQLTVKKKQGGRSFHVDTFRYSQDN